MKNLCNVIRIKRVFPKCRIRDFIFPIQYTETDTANGGWPIETTHMDQPLL
jgi:hypothetical protein